MSRLPTPPRAFSRLLDRALSIAAIVHLWAKRKGTVVPYIMHPVHVALILDRHDAPEDVVLAGVLHDVLEDGDWSNPEVRDHLRATYPASVLRTASDERDQFGKTVEAFVRDTFGDEVLRLVLDVTEKKTEGGKARPWLERKREQLEHLDRARPAHALLKAADALHNVSQLIDDLDSDTGNTMGRFNAGSRDTLWYYARVAGGVRSALGPAHPLGLELRDAVETLARRLETDLTPDEIRDALVPLRRP